MAGRDLIVQCEGEKKIVIVRNCWCQEYSYLVCEFVDDVNFPLFESTMIIIFNSVARPHFLHVY